MRYIPASVFYSQYVPLSFSTCVYDTAVSQAFKGVSADFDALVDLLESIEHFLKRLDIYTKPEVPPTPALTEIVVKIMVELLSTLALATKQIKQGRPSESVFAFYCLTQCNTVKFVKKLFGENEIEAVLQRLDRLTQDEARVTTALALEVVYGLFQNMNVVMDSASIHLFCQPLAVEHLPSRQQCIN
jgi:hypothetical protein